MFYAINDTQHEGQETLVIGLFQKSQLAGKAKQLDELLDGQITGLLKDGDITSKRGSTSKLFTPGLTETKRIYFVGLGREADYSYQDTIDAFSLVFRLLQKDKNSQSLTMALDSFLSGNVSGEEAAHALSETFHRSTYTIQNYKQKSNEPEKPIENVFVHTDLDLNEIQASLEVGSVYGKGANSARTLVNLPGNLLTAADLADYAINLANKYHFDYEVLDKKELEELGMGGLLAVNQGSSEPPKMIVLKYQGKETWDDVIGLVGKELPLTRVDTA
ncbi:leucyl aminopeptidase [Bacillus capparidis]|uniref:Probable cytosol aminopeptidase n=1 Tax=Bacillus capparidis TaxID=1840411 RepID=A0ABS4CU23_9BACI|nr:leucyl aminopeptidase [Bacillus capparidis]